MPPSQRIRRLCARLHFLANLLEKMRGAPASPASLEECLVQLEASAMLIEHQLSDQPPVTATILPARPSSLRRAGLLKFPSSPADSAPATPRQETRPCAVALP